MPKVNTKSPPRKKKKQASMFGEGSKVDSAITFAPPLSNAVPAAAHLSSAVPANRFFTRLDTLPLAPPLFNAAPSNRLSAPSAPRSLDFVTSNNDMHTTARALDMDSGVRTKKFKLSDAERAKNRERQSRFQKNKRLKEQIDMGFTAVTMKVFLGDIRGRGRIVEVQQLSDMKDVRDPSARRRGLGGYFFGAIVRLPDGEYSAIPKERFLVRVGCYAKHGTHERANWIIAKRLTGVVDGYVWIEWSNTEKHWIPKSSFMAMTTADKRAPRTRPSSLTQADDELKPSVNQLKQAELFYQYFKSKAFLDGAAGGTFNMETCLDLGGIAWERLQQEKKEQRLEEKRLDRLVVIALLNGIQLPVLPHKKGEKEKKQRRKMIEDVLKAISVRDETPMMPMPKNKSEEWQLLKGEIHYLLERFITTYWSARDSTPIPPLPSTLPDKEYLWRNVVTNAEKTIQGSTEIPQPPSLSSRPLPPAPSDDERVDLYLGLSLTYDIVRGNIPVRLGGQLDALLGIRGASATGEFNEYINAIIDHCGERDLFMLKKEQKAMLKPRPQCKVRGCRRLVHKMFTLDGCCYVHGDEEKKKCRVCKKNTSCRAGKLCRKCFDQAKNGSDRQMFCTVCKAREAKTRSDKCPGCANTKQPRKRGRS